MSPNLTRLMITRDQIRVYRCYHRLPPESGGMERHIASLTTEQRRLGVEAISVHNTGAIEAPAARVLPQYNLRKIRPAALRDLTFYAAARWAVQPPNDTKINVLHVHGDYSAFLTARLLAHHIKAKLIVASYHGSVVRSPTHYRLAMRRCDIILATGSRETRYLTEALGRQVHHLPSAPVDEFFSLQAGGPPSDVIVVGNLFPVKRTELVIECAACLPQVRFSIYGEGPERPRLEALIARLGCSNVTLHGTAPPDKVAAALQGARVFLNVSSGEGTPTAVLEAMACRLPVVLTPSNDYSWLVNNGSNGFVTSGWDVPEIVGLLKNCLADRPRQRVMGEANRAVAERHRWGAKAEFITTQMIEHLENVGS